MDYKERLKNFREQLPKLGKDVDGAVKFHIKSETHRVMSREVSFGARPDYNELKQKRNSEEDCVSMVVGLKLANFAFFVLKNHAEEHKADVKLSFANKGGVETINREVFDYFRAAVDLFSKIKLDINEGISFNEIIYKDLPGGEKETDSLFSRYRYFDTFSFLGYMQRKGYPIPKELAIEKKGNGKPVWVDRSSKAKKIIIPVTPETKWFQVHFCIVNPNRIEVKKPDGMEPYHPDELGFTRKIWDLFERFAAEGAEYIKEDKTDISRLRKLLKTVFHGVEGNPISYDKTKGYKANFHITEA